MMLEEMLCVVECSLLVQLLASISHQLAHKSPIQGDLT